jgi:hypothetical protein
MIKLKKNLKKIFLKKKYSIKNLEKTTIQKSIFLNFKKKNIERILLTKKKKKKILSRWQNCCFFLGLYKKQWKKINMSRFAIKYNNNSLSIPNLKVKSW